MKHSPYTGLWLLLSIALVALIGFSFMPPVEIGGIEVQRTTFTDVLTPLPAEHCNLPAATAIADTAPVAKPVVKKVELDTLPKSILFIGDSMLEGLSPRMASYAKHNGHKMNTVIWYSSTSEVWGRCDTLRHFIRKYRPDYIFVCLGANELFVRDIITKRAKYVDRILSQIGSIPYVWIGPPNWKKDTGINQLVSSKVTAGTYFMSDGMHFDRAKDGAHPTRSSAALWMDSVARWMKHNCSHPIKMEKPAPGLSRAGSVTVLQPQR